MSKILVIGVSNAGRNVCKKLKDDGLLMSDLTLRNLQKISKKELKRF